MLIGIVGKPSVGKSTFFKAATLADVDIANYPFTTIKPNHAMGYVRIDCVDKEFNKQCNPREGYCEKHQRFVPVELLDVAGLVPEAHLGKGKGNQFLNDLNQADVFIHVIDVSGSINAHGEPVETLSYDPAEDIKFLEVELDMWYLSIIKRGWDKFARQVQQEKAKVSRAIAKQLSAVRVTEGLVDDAMRKLNLDAEKFPTWNEEQLKQLASYFRKKTKPMLIAANKVDVSGADENYERLKKQFPDYTFVACSAEAELGLREAAKHELISYIPGDDNFEIIAPEKLNDKQKQALEFVRKNMLEKFGSTGLQKVLNTAVFELLKYITVFPGGVNNLVDSQGRCLPDCFLLPPNSTSLDFAFRIHTDIGNKFVRAVDVKTKMSLGKEHKLKHRDIIEIMTSR
ncbi:translation-associated GTPase [Candidatus Woesearchaeota archaeon CG10_big_fil_rev_8_21_14_0_10_34_8]|nr:MAG: translation-associated GTPase [Candidatus Woesearchaeota archaeon CG10_big_fil_rev_8_21_14_0_10_34_8]